MAAALSRGWVAAAVADDSGEVIKQQPVLQVTEVRLVGLDPRRFGLVLSDGVHSLRGRLVPDLGHLVVDGVLRSGTVLRAVQYLFNRNHRIIIAIKLEVLELQSTLIGSAKLNDEEKRKSGICTDLPDCQSYSGITLSSIDSWTGGGANYSQYDVPCGGSHSAEQGMMGSSIIVPSAEPVQWRTVAQIKDENLGCSDKADLIVVKAILSYVSTEDFCYTVCPLVVNGRQCDMKVTRDGDGRCYCERCKRCFESKSCDYRYVIVIQMKDLTDMAYAFAFQEAAEDIFGRTAKELYSMKYEEKDYAQFNSIVEGVLSHQYLFKLKVKKETFNTKQLVSCTVIKAEKVNAESESRYPRAIDSKLMQEVSGSPEIHSPVATNAGPSVQEPSNSGHTMSGRGPQWPVSTVELGQQIDEYDVVRPAISAMQNAQHCPSGVDREQTFLDSSLKRKQTEHSTRNYLGDM